jgi:hypothetical protein
MASRGVHIGDRIDMVRFDFRVAMINQWSNEAVSTGGSSRFVGNGLSRFLVVAHIIGCHWISSALHWRRCISKHTKLMHEYRHQACCLSISLKKLPSNSGLRLCRCIVAYQCWVLPIPSLAVERVSKRDLNVFIAHSYRVSVIRSANRLPLIDISTYS